MRRAFQVRSRFHFQGFSMSKRQKKDLAWIDAQDELPDDSERVLLFTPFPVFGDDHSCIGNKESIRTCTTSVNKKRVPLFTHWMPLPPAPGPHT